jgi:hypothetical protein
MRTPRAAQAPPVPFEEKLQALAYLNRNCEASSGRQAILRRMMELGSSAQVRAWQRVQGAESRRRAAVLPQS